MIGAVVPVGILEIGGHVGVVIAEQELDRKAGVAQPDQGLDDPAAVRPAIDVVAEEDQPRPRMRPLAEVAPDPGEHLGQEVEAAVDVADGVEPLPFGQIRHPPSRLVDPGG